MTRRQVLKLAGALGLALPMLGCSDDEAPTGGFDGRVLVIGAGAAGMSAGYLLAKNDVDVTIVEAAPTHGGRIKRAADFVDFPLPLGGEWLHEGADELAVMFDDPSGEITDRAIAYEPEDTYGYYEDGELQVEEAGATSDLKLSGATWLDLFDEHVVPAIADRMMFDTQIVAIDYTGDLIVATDASGLAHEADRVILSVPVRVLRDELIDFTPPLPEEKQEALAEAHVWGGMKVFCEFSEQFYPTFLELEGAGGPDGQHLYYDAAYGQASSTNVLGLFSVGTGAEPYQAQPDDDALRDFILAELDEIFDGRASATYMKHIAQNWSEEPFVGQAYLFDSSPTWIPRALWEPIGDNRVLFAGDAYTKHDDWSAVDDAARSARDTVDFLFS